ncbi:MAG TPA: hypothetical protein VFR95_03415 [Gemmatimonadaceae bacterium]|nr:hypothetical protein [Gemmatimonadaceae bacterium]
MRDQFAHARPVEEHMGARAEFIYDDSWEPARLLDAKPDIVLCVNDWPSGVARCLDAARDARIPSLVLQDGILEWRCQYENPLFGAGGGAPQHQPVLADRIACIGRQSARQIAAWGNAGRVEATGMPRLDHLFTREHRPRRTPGKCILVMTAKKAGFTEEQSAVTLRSLEDVREHLATLPDVEVIWRVSREMAEALGVANLMRETSSVELTEVVERSDAVITTLSTAILETMILDRPVAALDYHNVPRFVPTAWTISAREHVAPVTSQLLRPDARRMAFQRDSLRDCLECDGPAAPRVAALIERMVHAAAARRAGAANPSLDGRAEVGANGSSADAAVFAINSPSLAELYPGQPVFAEQDVGRLQVRLARAEKDRERLERELSRRSIARRLYALGKSIAGGSRDGRRS